LHLPVSDRRPHFEIAKTLQAVGYTGDLPNDVLAVKDGAPFARRGSRRRLRIGAGRATFP
jgi:hypothetical protein